MRKSVINGKEIMHFPASKRRNLIVESSIVIGLLIAVVVGAVSGWQESDLTRTNYDKNVPVLYCMDVSVGSRGNLAADVGGQHLCDEEGLVQAVRVRGTNRCFHCELCANHDLQLHILQGG